MHTPAQQRPLETVMAVIRATSILLGVYWLAIFIATHLPAQALPAVGSDKLYHVVAFGGLGLLLSWVTSARVRDVRGHALLVLGTALSYAMFDEWSQRFVAGRQPDLMDVLADAGGALLGLVCFWLVRHVFMGEVRFAKQTT